MATALSRSETEQKAVPAALRLGNTFAERTRLGAGAAAEWGAEKPGCRQLPKLPLGSPVGGGLYAASVFSPEKKTRKKKAPTTPPQLLVQDAETTGRQIEDRVAQLLSEEVEPSSTPPLPTSRILEEELARGSWALRPPGGAQNLLWEASALTGAGALESFYTASLMPPLVPQWPAKVCSLPVGQVGSGGEGGGSGCGTKRGGEETEDRGVESIVLSLQQPDGSHSRNREAHRFPNVLRFWRVQNAGSQVQPWTGIICL